MVPLVVKIRAAAKNEEKKLTELICYKHSPL
ncbi:MAG: hypothetical protein JWM99_4134, partial [Verrucomicrobiales bacterium]|nr:hypothetical protein [Verrucomicrobiales bacterium]